VTIKPDGKIESMNGIPYLLEIIHDTLCMINMDLSVIFDKAGKSTATIKPDGKIESMNGIPYLYINDAIDRKLSAFFLVYHYLPRKKTIK
jgi:hypothetical protein